MLLVAFVVFIYHCALSSSYWHFLMIERVRLGNVPGRCSTSCFFQCSFEGLQFFVKNSVKGSTRYRASHGCFRACMTIEKRKLHSFQLASSQNATFFFFFLFFTHFNPNAPNNLCTRIICTQNLNVFAAGIPFGIRLGGN